MSIGARIALVRPGGGLVFQAASQRTDLINPLMTQTQMIAGLQWLVAKGHVFELTAARFDHHDDHGLGIAPVYAGTHARGWAVDYLDAGDARFQAFLRDARLMPYLMQIGLTSDCYTPANIAAGGATVYLDDGGPHVHLGFRIQSL